MLLQFQTKTSFRNSDSLFRHLFFKSFLCKMSEDTDIRDFILDSVHPNREQLRQNLGREVKEKHCYHSTGGTTNWHNHFGKQQDITEHGCHLQSDKYCGETCPPKDQPNNIYNRKQTLRNNPNDFQLETGYLTKRKTLATELMSYSLDLPTVS